MKQPKRPGSQNILLVDGNERVLCQIRNDALADLNSPPIVTKKIGQVLPRRSQGCSLPRNESGQT
jgi:hypothetical protein